MRIISFSGLRARVLLITILAIIPWLLMTVYHAVVERRVAVSTAQQDALQFTRLISFNQQEIITHSHALLQTLSILPAIRDGLPADCLLPLANALILDSKKYTNIGVTDARGVWLCDARATPKRISSVDRSWFQQVLKARQFIVGNFVVGKASGKAVIVTALPIFDAHGGVKRVIFSSIDIDWFNHLLKLIKLPESTIVTVMDANGVIVAQRPDAETYVGKPNPLATVVGAIRANKYEGIGEDRGPEGILRLFAYHRLLENPEIGALYVSVATPRSLLLAEIDRVFSRNIGILGLFSVLIFILIWFGVDILILRKMKALILSAQQIAQGNLHIRTQLGQDKGEVGELARVFDDMAESLALLFQQSEHIMEVMPEAIIVSDGTGKIVVVNAQVEKLFGYGRDALIGQSIECLVPERLRATHVAHRSTYIAMTPPTMRLMGDGRELFARRKDGTEFSTEISLGPLKTRDGNFVISVIRDITERKQLEARIMHQASHDALTDLPNRLLFHNALVRATDLAQHTEKLLAILFLDLDEFKNINDTLGHVYGDILLKEIAQRLTATLRKDDLVARGDDLVARQGGDEFTILLQGLSTVQSISMIADKLLAVISEPFAVDGHEMHVTASIGITIFPFDDTDIEHLLQNADTAMFRAKESGRNKYQFYTAAMNALIRERIEIENGLRNALKRDELVLHYQPQANIESGEITGVEALVRWAHPEKGLIPPVKFISIAEESGLIVPIGEWVLRTACRQNKAWQDAGLPRIIMAVNLSARQFREPRLVPLVAKAMADAGLAQHVDNLELEVTESLLMKDMETTIATLTKLQEMGVCLSIDDFGTGYSSLSYLKRFPIHSLKIDQSFIQDITMDPDDAAIATTIISLAHNLKLRVIAEGVETAEQLALLREMKCDTIQGFYFSKPVPAEEIEKLLREGRRLS